MDAEKEELSSKSKFRWVLKIDDIQPFYLLRAQRPRYKIVQHDDEIEKKPVPQNMYFSFHDTTDNEMINEIYNWLSECNQSRHATLELLNKNGDITEGWNLRYLRLVEVDFGSLNYEDTSRCTIDITVSCEEATLDFLKMEHKTPSKKTA